jgi:hypothetical protein
MKKSETYALVEEVPAGAQGPLFTMTQPVRIVRVKGNRKDMHRLRKQKTVGTWMVYITSAPIGCEVH